MVLETKGRWWHQRDKGWRQRGGGGRSGAEARVVGREVGGGRGTVRKERRRANIVYKA